jgi:L-lactate utilization protein LutB
MYMKQFDKLAPDEQVRHTAAALTEHGMETTVVETGKEAHDLVEKMLPAGSEVMTATSVTLDAIGVTEHINEHGHHDAVKPKLMAMNRETHFKEMQRLGAAPDYIIGSVHAITEDGKVFVASNTGSQIPGYAYGAQHVIWVVGTQKIVKNFGDAMERIYEYALPLESERARKAYGIAGSEVNKILMVNKENVPGRIRVILVKEKLGF